MKKLTFFYLTLFCCCINVVHANGINHGSWFGFGVGGKHRTFQFSLGARGNSFGGDITLLVKPNSKDDDVLEYSIPHSDYHIKEKDVISGNPMGFNIYYYFNIKQQHSISLGAGLFFTELCDIAKSNVTGWEYEHKTETQVDVPISIGYQYREKNLLVGLGINSFTGVSFILGKTW